MCLVAGLLPFVVAHPYVRAALAVLLKAFIDVAYTFEIEVVEREKEGEGEGGEESRPTRLRDSALMGLNPIYDPY